MSTALPDPSRTADWLSRPLLVTPLTLGALCLTGPDALTFLQGQVTADMREITPDTSRLACLLNLKGRIQVACRILARPDGFLLITPADQLEALKARLARYAVFSKVSLETLPCTLWGIAGDMAAAALAAAGLTVPGEADATTDGLVRLPGARYWFIEEAATAALPAGLRAAAATDAADAAAAQAAWDCLSLQAGEYLPPRAASELHQPQELDMHVLHGVSYQKGCYLGQEIVARLYFRGQLKTRLAWLTGDWPDDRALPATGETLQDGDHKAGEVIATCRPAPGRMGLLALVRQDAASCTLHGTALSDAGFNR